MQRSRRDDRSARRARRRPLAPHPRQPHAAQGDVVLAHLAYASRSAGASSPPSQANAAAAIANNAAERRHRLPGDGSCPPPGDFTARLAGNRNERPICPDRAPRESRSIRAPRPPRSPRPAQDTQGEVLFDAASARPLLHRRIDLPDRCPWACSCRKPRTTSPRRSRSPPRHEVPVLPRGGGTSQCGQTMGAALVIDDSKHLRRLARGRPRARRGRGRARHRARRAQLAAEEARPLAPGRRVDLRPGHPRRHGRQQLLRQPLDRLRQHGAQRRRHRCLAGRRHELPTFGPFEQASGRAREHRRIRCARSAEQHRAEIDAPLAEGDAPRRRLQPRFSIRSSRGPTPTTAASTWRNCWSAPKARWPTSRRCA